MTKTKKEMYVAIMNLADVAANEEMVEFLKHEIELIDNRKSSDKPSAKQLENESIKDTIFQVLSEKGRMCLKDMQADSRLANYSTPKLSALLTQMIQPTDKHPNSDGRLVRTMEKKTPYFEIFTEDSQEDTDE